MNDDEIKAWLSEDERRMFAQTSVKPWARHVFTQLAETRKALAEHEWRGTSRDEVWCALCQVDDHPIGKAKHEPTCIFATMPRPR